MSETPELKARLTKLQSQLAIRASTSYLARAGIALLVSLMVSGGAGKLFWDAKEWLAFSVACAGAALALALAGYSVAQYRRGKGLLRSERALFEDLLEVRRTLGLDDPAMLLPR